MLTIFGLCTWYTFVIQQFDHPTTAIESGIFLALTRTMWPIGVSLLILLCVRGYAGPINQFLSSPRWLPYCRLSYAIYIVHMPIILVFTANSRRSFYFSNQTMVTIACNATYLNPSMKQICIYFFHSLSDSSAIWLYRLQCV